ncbi:hypothetical protein Cgig2_033217 [Carnegiea gigantea]|uniref:Uncharacterized protein n=1 Tax=Carnegiea gigantea TaxID=171969 RepID=A0A9Q1QAW3_9CARY|nr:hypothetical protein Cgig2_033217 [Carnegiea gigantea]
MLNRHALLPTSPPLMVDKTHRSSPLLLFFNQIGATMPKLPLPIVPNPPLNAYQMQSQMNSEGTLELSFWSLMGIKWADMSESLCSGKNDDYPQSPSHKATLMVALEYATTKPWWFDYKTGGSGGSKFRFYGAQTKKLVIRWRDMKLPGPPPKGQDFHYPVRSSILLPMNNPSPTSPLSLSNSSDGSSNHHDHVPSSANSAQPRELSVLDGIRSHQPTQSKSTQSLRKCSQIRFGRPTLGPRHQKMSNLKPNDPPPSANDLLLLSPRLFQPLIALRGFF